MYVIIQLNPTGGSSGGGVVGVNFPKNIGHPRSRCAGFTRVSLFLVKKIKDNGTQKAVQRQRMGILLCEQNCRNVWIRNGSVRAEIGQILHTDTHPYTQPRLN